ncbi:cytochrome c oxidase assembly protein [Ferrimonas balearica]|uniref:cytochrome c oxidase assembly protein n=1 Tax=Ferrimonas balearica TaxID=44012 RepID=UPI001C998EDD|nr:cytochrome c oxidase assembly protein [Ferrimonas balearica]MBY5994040.1 cytochrome c oxidase assembly protein [Ferrimonas balearica]
MAKRPNNARLITTLVAVVVGMFGFGFALVPLYDVFCEITGINGKTSGEVAAQSSQVDPDRVVTVEFIARVQGDMPWEFKPVVNRLKVHPGESRQVAFYAKNLSGADTVGQAIPSVSPGTGALYFSKVECFCFNQQPLAAGEDAELGLLFYLDPALPPEIQTVTLSYTLYNITDKVSERG